MKQLRLEILADYGIPEDVQDQFFHLAIEPDFPAQRQVKIMPLELFIDSARLHSLLDSDSHESINICSAKDEHADALW